MLKKLPSQEIRHLKVLLRMKKPSLRIRKTLNPKTVNLPEMVKKVF